MQASAKAMRLRAQGIATDAAFLEQEGAAPMDEGERDAAELAAAEGQFQAQLRKEVGVSRRNPPSLLDRAYMGIHSHSRFIVTRASVFGPPGSRCSNVEQPRTLCQCINGMRRI